jgi:NCAIR mutase (PurE)-related protein
VKVNRVHRRKGLAIKKAIPEANYYPIPGIITLITHEVERVGEGLILVITAGTSDIPVAEEAALTAEVMGNRVERLYDVGISGIHRLFSKVELIQSANVIIVVAGMEGALPSVVGGFVDRPVVAVPTSVGYGTSFGGVAAPPCSTPVRQEFPSSTSIMGSGPDTWPASSTGTGNGGLKKYR